MNARGGGNPGPTNGHGYSGLGDDGEPKQEEGHMYCRTKQMITVPEHRGQEMIDTINIVISTPGTMQKSFEIMTSQLEEADKKIRCLEHEISARNIENQA